MACKVEPTATQKKAASASHKYLRELMDTGVIVGFPQFPGHIQ